MDRLTTVAKAATLAFQLYQNSWGEKGGYAINRHTALDRAQIQLAIQLTDAEYDLALHMTYSGESVELLAPFLD